MVFYSDKNVYEAALDRIRFIFREFKDRNITVSFSGGKDSTVVLHLAHEVMKEFGIKKIPVFFCDQEVESPQTIEYVRKVMAYDWVEPYWIQSFFQEWNASAGEWFNVWGKGEEWVREKEPAGTYTEVEYPVTRMFKEVMHSMMQYHFGKDYVSMGGVRIEESPTRRLALTRKLCYKGITWGKCYGPWETGTDGLVLYPIWDWSYRDVWYYIFSNRLEYCRLYNYMFTKKPLKNCRVSSYIHENSIQGLKEIKEIAPAFYEKALKRVANVNTTVQTLDLFMSYVDELPKFFKDWDEYIFYLCDTIVGDPVNGERIKRKYLSSCKLWRSKMEGLPQEDVDVVMTKVAKGTAYSIVAEDFEMTKLMNKTLDIYKYIKHCHERVGRTDKKKV